MPAGEEDFVELGAVLRGEGDPIAGLQIQLFTKTGSQLPHAGCHLPVRSHCALADPTAAKGRAIAQISKDRTDYRFPLAVYKAFSGKNLEVSVRFKPVAGTVDEAGGVALRLLTPDDYYVARANALEDNVRFYRMVTGRREQLAGANTKVSANQWHTLALKAEGDRFTVSFDGKALISAQDRTFPDAGKVALWTKADSVTYFDTISIRPLK